MKYKGVVNLRVVLSVDTVVEYDDDIGNDSDVEVNKCCELREYLESKTNKDFHIDVSDVEVY